MVIFGALFVIGFYLICYRWYREYREQKSLTSIGLVSFKIKLRDGTPIKAYISGGTARRLLDNEPMDNVRAYIFKTKEWHYINRVAIANIYYLGD